MFTTTDTGPAPRAVSPYDIPDHDARALGLDVTDGPDEGPHGFDTYCEHMGPEGYLFGPCQHCDDLAYIAFLNKLDASMMADPDDPESVRAFLGTPDYDNRADEAEEAYCGQFERIPGWWLTPGTPQWRWVR
jgi:hypothetical protein